LIRIRHNGAEKHFENLDFANLGDVMRACAGADESQVVTSLSVNGCAIPDESLETLEEFPVEGIEEVEVQTRAVREVALDSLDSSISYGNKIEAALLDTASRLRAGKIQDANEIFADTIDALNVFLYALGAIGKALGEDGDELFGLEEELKPWLDELIEAQLDQDWLRVADFAEFEVVELISEWSRRLRRVQKASGRQEGVGG
jgi:hypothetical protein